MKTRILQYGLVVVLAFGLSVQPVAAQDPPPDSAEAAEMAAMMKIWDEMAAPVEQHQQLAEMVGTWDASMNMWMEPGAPPMTSTGVGTFSLLLGGRYLKHDFEGNAFGRTFKGLGITGYDKFRGEFFDLWFDDMSTGMMITRGNLDSTGSMMCYTGKMDDPGAGLKDLPCRSAFTTLDADTRKMEMWVTGTDGVEFKTMEIIYKRRK